MTNGSVWRVNEDGLLTSRNDRDRLLDAAARGLPVPSDILHAAKDLATWARFARSDWEATRWLHSGPTWGQRLDRDVPGWDADPPGWLSYHAACAKQGVWPPQPRGAL